MMHWGESFLLVKLQILLVIGCLEAASSDPFYVTKLMCNLPQSAKHTDTPMGLMKHRLGPSFDFGAKVNKFVISSTQINE
jgi:hypothetical protein